MLNLIKEPCLMPDGIVRPDMRATLLAARVPEHSLGFMEAMSGGDGFLVGAYLFLAQPDWLMAIGYPLHGEYQSAEFEAALAVALEGNGPQDCFAIAPALPPRLIPYCVEEDAYFTLPSCATVPSALRRHVRRAGECLRVEKGTRFTPHHRRLWAEMLARPGMRPAVRELYAKTESVLDGGIPGVYLLNALDADDQLCAALLIDQAPAKFCSYIIGAHSRAHYAPHATDMLFAALLESARAEGKEYIHLGLGVHGGIRRFKEKWGGRPAIPYYLAAWREAGSGRPVREGVSEFMHKLRVAPSDLSKQQFLAAQPEQRPFAMLWEVEKGGRKSWLGGTAHFFYYSFSLAFERLFAQAETVIFEGPLDQASLEAFERSGRARRTGDADLMAMLAVADLAILKRVVRGPEGFWARLLGLEHKQKATVEDYLLNTRPWFAFFSLWTAFLERHGWRCSVDLEAWNTAKNMGKSVVAMESLEEQLASLESVPPERIINFFRRCLEWPTYMRRNLRAYLDGDLSGMMGTSTEFPSRVRTVVGLRDQRFRERMRPFLEEGRAVVLVGTAHLLNLRPMLREDGFSVRQVSPTWRHKLRACLGRPKEQDL